MIAERNVKHRLAWWSFSLLPAALIALICLPAIGGAKDTKSGGEVHGSVQKVDAEKRTVTVSTKTRGDVMFDLAKDAEVLLDDGTGQSSGFRKGQLTDLAKGVSVTLRLSRDKDVVRIKAEGPTVRGILKVADTVKRTVTVAVSLKKDAPPVDKTFPVAKKVAIFIKGAKFKDKSNPAGLLDLPVNTAVSLKLSFDRKSVGRINAEGRRVSGRVKSVDAAKRTISITISRKGDVDFDRTYTVARSASITVDEGKQKDKFKSVQGRGLADVPAGAQVSLQLSLDGKSVVSLQARGASLSGRVKAVDASKGTLTLLSKNKGKTIETVERKLSVGPKASIILDDKQGSKLGDVPVGAIVFVNLQADGRLVREIRAVGPTVMGRVVGDSVNNTLTLGEKRGDKVYNVPDKARIVIEGRKPGKLTDLIDGTVAHLRLSVDKSNVLEVRAEGPRYGGLVKRIDPETQMITLTIGGKDGVGGKDKEFKLSKSTVITRQAEKTRFDLKDVQVGNRVVLRLSIDQKLVKSLVVQSE